MRTLACQPCAKRKVRCDRKEPCSNCKRRKQDQCIYTEVSAAERIKQLEELVRSLEQSPESEHNGTHALGPVHEQTNECQAMLSVPTRVRPAQSGSVRQQSSANPVLVKEGGELVYLESSTWDGWNQRLFDPNTALQAIEGHPRAPFPPSIRSSALQSIICHTPYIDVASRHPTVEDATMMWETFNERVQPVVMMSFKCELERMQAIASAPRPLVEVAFPEHAFMFSVYLITISTLSQDECLRLLRQPKSILFADYQMLCEQAFAGSNFFVASDLITIQAIAMYITAGVERINTRSLWSLFGIVIRNSERCGLHRDGTVLGLSPYETERRRRTWWQLQHIDLMLGVKSGSIPLTLNAPWDANLPLNIEDEDISADMIETPKEREGLSSISHCLWTFWVLREQRTFCRSDGSILGFSWAADMTLSRSDKDALINRLEVGLNKRYVQFCDPIRPLDVLIQITARSFLSKMSDSQREKLLDVCMQALEYDVALHTNPLIKQFEWRIRGYFQWSALIYVLVDARRNSSAAKVQKTWTLLSRVYSAHPDLAELADDRRKSYAAELMVAVWRAHENSLAEQQGYQHSLPRIYPKPDFLVDLENKLTGHGGAGQKSAVTAKRRADEADGLATGPSKKIVPASGIQNGESGMNDVVLSQSELDAIAEIDFDAIDWSFWETVP